MNKMNLILAAFLAIPLVAQAGPYVAGGLLAAAQDSATSTQQTWGGFALEGGYTLQSRLGFTIRPHIGMGYLPGKKNLPGRDTTTLWGPNSYNQRYLSGGFDLVYSPSERFPVRIFMGPDIHSWNITRVEASGKMGTTKARMGWRLGAEYELSAHWSASLAFTQTEWQSITDGKGFPGYKDPTSTPSYLDGINPCHPAYYSLMANYRF